MLSPAADTGRGTSNHHHHLVAAATAATTTNANNDIEDNYIDGSGSMGSQSGAASSDGSDISDSELGYVSGGVGVGFVGDGTSGIGSSSSSSSGAAAAVVSESTALLGSSVIKGIDAKVYLGLVQTPLVVSALLYCTMLFFYNNIR